MIREAMKYIADLARDSQDIITKEIDGEVFTKERLHRLELDSVSCMDLNTLGSTVDYIRDLITNEEIQTPYIVNIEHNRVKVYSGLNRRKDRDLLIDTKPLLPHIYFGEWMDMETFVIHLNTCFEETTNLKNLIKVVSTITDQAKVEMEDDGFGLKVTQTSGTTIKKAEEFNINPIVKLIPYRTFTEVKQPESKFLLRVKDGGKLSLNEADGGMWKLEAQNSVSTYLRNALRKEIENGKVVVVG